MAISRAIEDPISAYKRVLPHYEIFAVSLRNILHRATALHAPLAIVQARAKSLSSFAEKAARKADKYADPLRQMTDLCGARIITHTQAEADRICHFIEANFEIDWANSLDVRSRLNVSEFGYLSVHYVLTPKGDEILGVPIPPEIRDKKAEIQVRTILQHAWADISHDRFYKSPFKIPPRWIRESARLAALLENADAAFEQLATTIDTLSSSYGPLLSPKEFDDEVSILTTVLEHEPEPSNRPSVALRLARLFASVGRWGEVVKVLEPFRDTDSLVQVQALIELGRAYCELNRHNPQADAFRAGQELLIKATNDAVPSRDKAARIDLPEVRASQAAARAYLADSYRYSGDPEGKARELYYEAYRLHTSDPYYLTAYLESEIAFHHNADFVMPLRAAIQSAISTCREHIELGIEIPRAFFTIAKLHLLLDEPYRALNTCAKAVEIELSRKAPISPYRIDDEMDSLDKLRLGLKQAVGFPWMDYLLKLTKTAQATEHQKTATDSSIRSPILIVVGDCETLPDDRRRDYTALVEATLTGFHGTVIYGGLTTGVPGIVGGVARSLAEAGKADCNLRACIPRLLPSTTAKDTGVDVTFVITPGEGFSPYESLECWNDLISARVDPHKVRALGLGGVANEGFTYRLALALGAMIGVGESGGRAVSELLSDPDWFDHERLLVLPNDPMTLWTFANLTSASPWPTEQLEMAARKVHERYLKIRKGGKADLALVPWEYLSDELKESNRQQVISISGILGFVGFTVRPSVTPATAPDLPAEIIEKMAEIEHGRWNMERLRAGWKFGPHKDIEKRLSPYIIPWRDLPENIKDYDRSAAGQFALVMTEAGFEVVPPEPKPIST